MSYGYTPLFPTAADVVAVAKQLAQRQSDVATSNGGITATGGSTAVPQLGVDAAGLGLAYLQAIADATMCSVGFQGQDWQAATVGSSTSTTFVDVAGYPSWSFNAPVTKTYLVHVDLTVYLGSGVMNQTLSFQLVCNGAAVGVVQPYIFHDNTWSLPISFRVPVAMTAGANVLKLQWMVTSGNAQTTVGDFRCFTVTG